MCCRLGWASACCKCQSACHGCPHSDKWRGAFDRHARHFAKRNAIFNGCFLPLLFGGAGGLEDGQDLLGGVLDDLIELFDPVGDLRDCPLGGDVILQSWLQGF